MIKHSKVVCSLLKRNYIWYIIKKRFLNEIEFSDRKHKTCILCLITQFTIVLFGLQFNFKLFLVNVLFFLEHALSKIPFKENNIQNSTN